MAPAVGSLHHPDLARKISDWTECQSLVRKIRMCKHCMYVCMYVCMCIYCTCGWVPLLGAFLDERTTQRQCGPAYHYEQRGGQEKHPTILQRAIVYIVIFSNICIYVCVYVCMYVCMYVCTVCTYARVSFNALEQKITRIYVYTYVCMYVYMYKDAYAQQNCYDIEAQVISIQLWVQKHFE